MLSIVMAATPEVYGIRTSKAEKKTKRGRLQPLNYYAIIYHQVGTATSIPVKYEFNITDYRTTTKTNIRVEGRSMPQGLHEM